MTIEDLEKAYGAKFPPDLARLYATTNGETSSPAGWRFNTLEEMGDCGLKDMLDHGEGEYVLSLGPVLPILTNDASDLLVLQTTGPLEGHLLFVMHDCGDIFLAFRSLSSFLAAREQGRYKNAEGDRGWFDYNEESKATDADKQTAARLRAFHEASDDAEAGQDFYERAIADLTR
jgi:hypothetical protein